MEILKITYIEQEKTYVFDFEGCKIFIDNEGDFIGSVAQEGLDETKVEAMTTAAEAMYKLVKDL